MSAAASRLPPGEGALGGEVVGDEVPRRDRRAEPRVSRAARRARLEHLAVLPAEPEAQLALRLFDPRAHSVQRDRRRRSGRARRRAGASWSEGPRFVSQRQVRFNRSGRETVIAESGPRTGVWIIGARGAVATTTIVGARAAARGLVPLRGVTTEGPRGEGLALPAASALVFGGWELRAGSLLDAAADLAEGRLFDG